MRQGQNALDVIGRVKEKIREITPGLPEGVEVVEEVGAAMDWVRRAVR